MTYSIGSGPLMAELGNAVSDAIHAALKRGLEVDEACSVATKVVGDYWRGAYGSGDLPNLAALLHEGPPPAREDAQPVAWPDKDTVRASTVRSRSKLGKDDLARHNFAFEVAETIIGDWIVKGDKRGNRDLMIQAVDLALSIVTHPATDALREHERLFKALRDESWDLRCFNIPTGGDDFDIGWRVIGHWQAEPCERTVAEVFSDDPAEAVRQALAALQAEQGAK